jgi:hypothetical protein
MVRTDIHQYVLAKAPKLPDGFQFVSAENEQPVRLNDDGSITMGFVIHIQVWHGGSLVCGESIGPERYEAWNSHNDEHGLMHRLEYLAERATS